MSRDAYNFEFNPNLEVSLLQVGASGQPVLVVDDAMVHPQSLVEFAAHEANFAAAWTAQGGYPGVRSEAPRDYVRELLRRLGNHIESAFFPSLPVAPAYANCLLSIVTRRPEQLTNQQRIPHFDTPDPMRIAVLHYLCDPSFGGTAFYCHRRTGLDAVPPDREAEFCRLRDEELKEAAPPAAFISGDTTEYQQTAVIEARFNRLIVYRSQHFHSGLISPGMNFSEDPRKGRLTATIFFGYRQV